MLTQQPTPDPKCKLIISSFIALPHLLDCPICTRNAIVLLLQMMAGRDRGGGGGGVVLNRGGGGGGGGGGGSWFIIGSGWNYRG